MIFTAITKVLGPKIGMAGLTVKNYSPEIYLVSAIGAGVASAIMLAKAHRKSDEVFEDVVDNIRNVRDYVADANEDKDMAEGAPDRPEPISMSEEQRMLAPLYMEAVRDAAILYGPAVLMGISAIALLMASHGTLRGRNRALLSALTLFERGFAEYRKRVVDEYGEEADERLYYGADGRKITTLTKNKDGKTTKKKSIKNHIPESPSPMIYSRTFDEGNMNWSPDSDMSQYFLSAVQQQMNDTLYIQGYVTLNTVYKGLGFAESPEGAVVGWSKNCSGDDYISFGMENDINQRDGDNRWILDFNVNGVMYQRIGDK
jgi:hypothetical protein